MKWTDVEAVIPAVLSVEGRADSLRDLLVQLGQQCPGIVARVLPQYDRPEDVMRHVFETVAQGLQGISRPWVFYIEEDVMLRDDFGKVAPVACEAADADVISFFSKDADDVERLRNGTKFYAPFRFSYAQCLAFKREAAEAWRDRMLPWFEQYNPIRPSGVDQALGDCMRQAGFSLVVHLPSLVQHLPVDSSLDHGIGLQSPTFNTGMEH